MTNVNMDLVRELREKTQVGLMDCKKALAETHGDIEKAIDLLRKKGASVALKRADMATNEGIIAAYVNPQMTKGALIEIACETDFAANTEAMKKFAQDMAKQAGEKSSTDSTIESILSQKADINPALTVKQVLDEITAKISENIKFSRFAKYEVSGNGLVQTYIHPGSRLGIMISMQADKSIESIKTPLAQLAKDICMQIAVTCPLALDPAKLDPQVIEREKDVYRAQLAASGKPAQMIEKILEGKLSKYYEDVCLLNQKFIKNDKTTIQQYIADFAKAHAVNLKVASFVRFAISK